MTKLLLIDDEKPTRKVLGLYLRSKGYEVITAADGREGIELFQREKPSIVLTDIKMPGTDGLDVLKIIKQMDPETEVIVITGHGDVDTAIKSLELEASDFITKPIANEALSVALKRAKEKLRTKRMLKDYTNNLEARVRKATEELRERYEFEGNLIQHSIDGIVATDARGNIVTFNQGAERLFGYSHDDVVGKMSIVDLYPHEIAGEIKKKLIGEKTANQSDGEWKEITVLGKGGTQIPARFSGTLLRRNGNIIGSVSFFHDLREVKRLEKELLEKERLSTIGQTVASLAHYIKNILYGLEGGVYVVNKGIRKNNIQKLKKGWDIVQRNIAKLSDLVLELLNYSKEREPEYEWCSPNTIADEVCELMECKARETQVELRKNLDPHMEEALLDPKGIHRCLLNLVSNAIGACASDENFHKDFIVTVATKRGRDNSVTFQVSDNGPGMDEEVRKKLFSGLFSTKGSKGTGLGLLITRKIVQEHGGTIEVHSNPGEGAIFTMRLPTRHPEGDEEALCNPEENLFPESVR
ncbi:MAG: histidine kinase [Thermoplasmata archaeon]|nr:MAG: hypothetical protein B1H13_12405 [Desulfobacteraceae bacterium 4484_190.3]RLB15938.1 MAG: histidine kinase [Deltaproteobacteria bacterium]RLF61610.1 MAG: histidine kinase [Thermoplasmata archaeon]